MACPWMSVPHHETWVNHGPGVPHGSHLVSGGGVSPNVLSVPVSSKSFSVLLKKTFVVLSPFCEEGGVLDAYLKTAVQNVSYDIDFYRERC